MERISTQIKMLARRHISKIKSTLETIPKIKIEPKSQKIPYCHVAPRQIKNNPTLTNNKHASTSSRIIITPHVNFQASTKPMQKPNLRTLTNTKIKDFVPMKLKTILTSLNLKSYTFVIIAPRNIEASSISIMRTVNSNPHLAVTVEGTRLSGKPPDNEDMKMENMGEDSKDRDYEEGDEEMFDSSDFMVSLEENDVMDLEQHVDDPDV